LINQQIQILKDRFIDGTGFVDKADGTVRPDATCWAILALQCAQMQETLIQSARRCLASMQSKDGRVCITPHHPESYWPTSLAILAWQGAPEHRDSQAKAIRFLDGYNKVLNKESPKEIIGYDTKIIGWSWMANTYSWVEPSALGVIALRAAGHKDQRRMQDAVALLMDRQLPDGGWNCGSSIIFGQALRPIPANTGMALQALYGFVPEKDVENSIRYLRSCLVRLRTPFTLGWSLLGLGTWAQSVENRHEIVSNVLRRQDEHGPFDTTSLSVLLVAYFCENGLIDLFDRNYKWNKT